MPDSLLWELRLIEVALSQRIGRSSRWNGEVIITHDPGIRGAKPFRCAIVVNAALTHSNARWRTLIHELLHTYSEGYSSQSYQEFRGWEEGVIEHLQRHLRPAILTQLNVVVAEEVFVQEEQGHVYTNYIAALEALRQALKAEMLPFYLELLATAISARPVHVLNMGLGLELNQRQDYWKTFTAADAVLKRRILI